jgi:hypothetical protein
MDVKTRRYDAFQLESELRAVAARIDQLEPDVAPSASAYVREWYAPSSAAELLAFRDLVGDYEHADVLRVVLSRAARSARLAAHFDLDFPRASQRAPYWCHKHRRTCRPVETARPFLRRYALDTLARLKAFGRVRAQRREAVVLHGDSRQLDLPEADGIVTSPPYPGLIDYHEQHRYAYELLDLAHQGDAELGRPASGAGRDAIARYCDDVVAVLENAVARLPRRAPVIVVVNDRRGFYPGILERAGLRLERRLRRHVNRRTGRRSGEFFEDVLVARAG